MEQWISSNIGTVVTIIGMVIGFIAGYVKLQYKNTQNQNQIEAVKVNCMVCKNGIQTKFKDINADMNRNIQKIHDQIAQIKTTISSMSSELGKISGILQTYMKYYTSTSK